MKGKVKQVENMKGIKNFYNNEVENVNTRKHEDELSTIKSIILKRVFKQFRN